MAQILSICSLVSTQSSLLPNLRTNFALVPEFVDWRVRMKTRRDYYQKRASCADPLLQNYTRHWRYQKRKSTGKIEPPAVSRQRSPSACAAFRHVISGPNELLPPTRATSSLMLHPGENTDPSPRRLSVSFSKQAGRSQPASPDNHSAVKSRQLLDGF